MKGIERLWSGKNLLLTGCIAMIDFEATFRETARIFHDNGHSEDAIIHLDSMPDHLKDDFATRALLFAIYDAEEEIPMGTCGFTRVF